jgi:hypothetical protein
MFLCVVEEWKGEVESRGFGLAGWRSFFRFFRLKGTWKLSFGTWRT